MAYGSYADACCVYQIAQAWEAKYNKEYQAICSELEVRHGHIAGSTH